MKGKKSKIIGDILTTLATGAGIVLVLSSPYGARRLISGIRHDLKEKKLKREYLMTKFYYLRDKQMIRFVEKEGVIEIEITEKGRRQLRKYRFDEMKLAKPRRWDKKWRVVLFDIPEHKKRGRDALREKMRSLGLVCFNDSAWVYPYECKDEIDFVADVFDVGNYVHYLCVESMTNSDNLRRVFRI